MRELPSREALINEWRRRLARPASRIIVGGFRPSEDPLASWFGRVRVALPGEPWPAWQGRPMWPLCQLNLTEAPFVPENLTDLALMTVFIADQDFHEYDLERGDGWAMRAYPSLDGLIEIDAPEHASTIRPFPIRWELVEADFPNHDDLPLDYPEEVIGSIYDQPFYSHDYFSKIGGWPNLVQAEIYWGPLNQHPANPKYAFQLDSEYKAHWAWGDQGVGYFGRGTGPHRDVWSLTWQCL